MWQDSSLEYIGNDRSHFLEWLRLPGNLVFILFGSLPLAIAAVKAYLGVCEEQSSYCPVHRIEERNRMEKIRGKKWGGRQIDASNSIGLDY